MRKGVSPMIATVLLITITVTLAFIIFSSGKEFLAQLSPAPNCEGVVFEAGIYETVDGYILEIDNSGNIDLEGFNFIIADESKGEINLKSTSILVKAGESASKAINFENSLEDKKINIIPSIKNAQDKVMACDFSRDAQKIELKSIPQID